VCARAIVQELPMIGLMGGGKRQALHSGMRGHNREPIPPAFGPITRAPKLRSSVIALVAVRFSVGRRTPSCGPRPRRMRQAPSAGPQ
jgi:hypothetical protein